MEIFCFWEINTFSFPMKEKKNSPASSSCYQHRAWASLTTPSCQTKIHYTLQPYQISVVAVSHRWASHYVHLVHGVRFIADTLGNECPTVKELSREDPIFSEKQLESQSIPTVGISAPLILGRCSWHKQTCRYNWQAAVMTLGRETRWWMAMGPAPAPPCPLAARLACCAVADGFGTFTDYRKIKKFLFLSVFQVSLAICLLGPVVWSRELLYILKVRRE